jgi:hypothetical protein
VTELSVMRSSTDYVILSTKTLFILCKLHAHERKRLQRQYTTAAVSMMARVEGKSRCDTRLFRSQSAALTEQTLLYAQRTVAQCKPLALGEAKRSSRKVEYRYREPCHTAVTTGPYTDRVEFSLGTAPNAQLRCDLLADVKCPLKVTGHDRVRGIFWCDSELTRNVAVVFDKEKLCG